MRSEYKLIEVEGEFMECQCCESAVPLASFQTSSHANWLCEVCSRTFFSKAINYPQQCSDPALYKSIATGINMILDRLRGGEETEVVCLSHEEFWGEQ